MNLSYDQKSTYPLSDSKVKSCRPRIVFPPLFSWKSSSNNIFRSHDFYSCENWCSSFQLRRSAHCVRHALLSVRRYQMWSRVPCTVARSSQVDARVFLSWIHGLFQTVMASLSPEKVVVERCDNCVIFHCVNVRKISCLIQCCKLLIVYPKMIFVGFVLVLSRG